MPCNKTSSYWQWIKAEALKINSDGCSFSHEWAECCCFEHDLSYYYGRDPRHAFIAGWERADKITFMGANNRFAGCLPWYLKYRWIAVSLFGPEIWAKHRAKRP